MAEISPLRRQMIEDMTVRNLSPATQTGAPWRDLPNEFGKWYTIYTRFWRWAKRGVWERIFKHLSEDSDFEYVLIDATLVRVHQHGTGAKGGLKIRPSANRAAA